MYWKNGFLLKKKFLLLFVEMLMVKQPFSQSEKIFIVKIFLHETIVPARISEKAKEMAIEKAIQLAKALTCRYISRGNVCNL